MLAGPQEYAVRGEAEKAARVIASFSHELIVLGPSPAVLEKIANDFRFSLLVKSRGPKLLAEALYEIRMGEKDMPKKTKLIIDVDPVYML